VTPEEPAVEPAGALRLVMQIGNPYHLHEEGSVRTTLNIDDEALAGAMKTAGGKTKTAVINEALREYARRRRVRRLLEFRGKARWEGSLDDLRGRERSDR
jgi:Arc/MetJ family transcription regulator